VCALPRLQVDLDLRDAVARLLDFGVTFGQLRRVDDGRGRGCDGARAAGRDRLDDGRGAPHGGGVDEEHARGGGERVQSHGEPAAPGRDVNRLPHKTSRPPCSIQTRAPPNRPEKQKGMIRAAALPQRRITFYSARAGSPAYWPPARASHAAP